MIAAAAGSLTASGVVVASVAVGSGLVAAVVARLWLRRVGRRFTAATATWSTTLVRILEDLVPVGTAVVGIWVATLHLPLTPAGERVAGRVLVALVVLAATIAAARLAAEAVRAFALRRAGVAPSTSLLTNITRATVLVVGILVMLDTFGISIAPLLTALGVGGLAVALALQDSLANLFAGIHILASKNIEPGDFLQLSSGEAGYVVDVNWRNTAIRALPNNMVLVPNAQLASQVLVNYHQPQQELSVLVQVGVSYDSDLEQVERVTVEVAREVMREVDGAVRDHQPSIRFHTFNQSSIDFSVILRAREYSDQYVITHEFIKRLQPRYRREGIEIPFPIRTVVLQPGEEALAGGSRSDGLATGAPLAGPEVGPGADEVAAGGARPLLERQDG